MDNSENVVREKIIVEEETRRLLRLLIAIQSNYTLQDPAETLSQIMSHCIILTTS